MKYVCIKTKVLLFVFASNLEVKPFTTRAMQTKDSVKKYVHTSLHLFAKKRFLLVSILVEVNASIGCFYGMRAFFLTGILLLRKIFHNHFHFI
jgi:hypothetical protein